VRYTEILSDLKDEGRPVRGRDVAHLSPARHAHVNPYGRYSFDLLLGAR
jgi:rRNA maturation protein Nop10